MKHIHRTIEDGASDRKVITKQLEVVSEKVMEDRVRISHIENDIKKTSTTTATVVTRLNALEGMLSLAFGL